MKPCLLNFTQDEEMEDDAELLLERVEEEMAEDYSEEEDGYDDHSFQETVPDVFLTRDVLHIDELGAFPSNERTGSGTRVQHERPEPYLQSRWVEAQTNKRATDNQQTNKQTNGRLIINNRHINQD